MSEAILSKDWLSQVELAFEAVKDADDITEREAWFEVIRDDEGLEALAELKARLAAHDEAKRAKAEVKPADAKPNPLRNGLRRDLNGAKAAHTPRDAIKIAAASVQGVESSGYAVKPAPDPETKPIVPQPMAPEPLVHTGLEMDAPYEIARRFLFDRYSLKGVATLRWWNAEWRKWAGTHYGLMEEDALRAEIYQFLATANGGKLDPAPKHVNAVIDAIKAWVLLPADIEVGTWLGDSSAPWGDEAIICCKNGVLRLSDGKLWSHDPRLFSLNVIETEHRPEAQAPRWTQFLEEVWGEDQTTRNALQEFFGLVLTDETKFQKGFILVGPARSGKGTIARVLMHLLGRANFCGPSLGQLAQTFACKD